jgi:molybdenum cofactor cytidylyltransferase
LYGNEFMTTKPNEITVILLAAGASSRMKNADKLLEKIDGVPILKRISQACLDSNATNYIAVVRPDDIARKALISQKFCTITNSDWRNGMAASLRAGLANVNANCAAILVVLADMPDVCAADMNALIAAFDPENGHTICRATSEDGIPGHPVLFGHTHFSALGKVTGDTGVRAVLVANPDAIKWVKTRGQSALIDLDTPQDWAAYRSRGALQ